MRHRAWTSIGGLLGWFLQWRRGCRAGIPIARGVFGAIGARWVLERPLNVAGRPGTRRRWGKNHVYELLIAAATEVRPWDAWNHHLAANREIEGPKVIF